MLEKPQKVSDNKIKQVRDDLIPLKSNLHLNPINDEKLAKKFSRNKVNSMSKYKLENETSKKRAAAINTSKKDSAAVSDSQKIIVKAAKRLKTSHSLGSRRKADYRLKETVILRGTFSNSKKFKTCFVEVKNQTQNERDAISNSTIFSKLEKRYLKVNNFLPVLIDVMLLQKLMRLDKVAARTLIFSVFEQLNMSQEESDHLENSETEVNDNYLSEDFSQESDMSLSKFIAQKTDRKRLSLKKFVTQLISKLLHARLMRTHERPAEVLHFLLMKICFNKQSVVSDSAELLRAVKKKINSYNEQRTIIAKRKLAKRKSKLSGLKKSKKRGKKKGKFTEKKLEGPQCFLDHTKMVTPSIIRSTLNIIATDIGDTLDDISTDSSSSEMSE